MRAIISHRDGNPRNRDPENRAAVQAEENPPSAGSGSGLVKTLNSLHAASQSVSAGLRKTADALNAGGFKSSGGRNTLEKLLRDYADRLDNAI